ncbi:MAG: IS630 family transposase [Desulfobacteraceae bacterium]|nr:IS630 family transposase [Desulfobacteraceae bacterium]
MPHRYVSDLTEDEIITLKEMVKNHDSYPVRRRAHAVLLSYEKSGIKEIVRVCMASRNSVSSWLKAWETEGIRGLYDLPRSGAPPELTEADIEIIGKFVKEHPNSPKVILAKSIEKTGKKFSKSSLKRIIKKLNMRWKRVRKTVRKERDPEKYGKSLKEIEKYEEQQKAGIADLYFSDQSGFSSGSFVPYAYQPVGETLGIPSSGGGRINVIGFYSKDNRMESFCFKNTIHAGVISACSDEFSKIIIKKLMYLLIILRCITVRNSEKIFRDGGKESYISDIYLRILPN